MASSTVEYNPFLERNVKLPTTDFETFIHLVKGSLGAGILAMPSAFRDSGLWAGIPGTVVVCLICSYCIHMLVKCSQTLCFRRRIPQLTYADTVEMAFVDDVTLAPNNLSKFMRFTVSFFLVIDMLGCVCIYLVNVSRNVQQIVDQYQPQNKIDIRMWILILACPLLFLALIRDLKYLVPFSLIANIFVFISIAITASFVFTDMPSPTEREAIAEFKHWPSFFGTSIFALECVAVVLPLENNMKTPQHFTGCPSVMVAAMTCVSVLYTLLGFFGYLKYGLDIEANISLNLPVESIWAQSVKLMVAAAIYFTTLLQYYVAMQIILNAVQKSMPENWKNTYENCIRIGLIIVCTLIAASFPDLGPFISLVGAICLSILGLILPAVLDLVVFRIDPGYGWIKIRLIKDIGIIIFGVIGFIAGTITSIEEFSIP